ncbi:hypothetical protein [Enterococcus plantarum]|uniref:hypothetical protein n=1 Tax=Enterococcus plantarum TaxID=1077675 RepID=UPI001A8DE42A|nr:hypothetical protein [Enterococcus plantarum]MBO0423584.1 hypothetical protein [Enterococcus plantarum]
MYTIKMDELVKLEILNFIDTIENKESITKQEQENYNYFLMVFLKILLENKYTIPQQYF